jgi:hypothetical protein
VQHVDFANDRVVELTLRVVLPPRVAHERAHGGSWEEPRLFRPTPPDIALTDVTHDSFVFKAGIGI